MSFEGYPPDFGSWPIEKRNEYFAEQAHRYRERQAGGPRAPSVSSVSFSNSHFFAEWPEPKPLPNGLAPVKPFDMAFLPESIARWVADIAERMQCPPDFVAVPAIIALGAVIGRKIGVRPQRRTDWIEVPNLWGCIVGRPGMMKSPAMSEALKPLHRLDALAREEHAKALRAHAGKLELHKLELSEAKAAARAALKTGGEARPIDIEEPEEPKARRYVVNDTTYEALGEILEDNPNGVLAFRDELVSLLKTLDREEFVAARGFFLTAWNGTTGYTFDRILRGKTHIEAACLSLLGSTQPGRLAEYIRRAVAGGAGDDGLIQRFGLLVWPDQDPEWREVDRYPNSDAREIAWKTFERLDKLDPDAIEAERDTFELLPFLRFDEQAQGDFADWRRRPRRSAAQRRGHVARTRKPSCQVSQARSGARAHQPPRRWRSRAHISNGALRALERWRITSKRTRGAPMAPERRARPRRRNPSLLASARATFRTASRRETSDARNGLA